MKSRTWQSRLPERKADPAFEAMNASIGVDIRLIRHEIAASKAHAAVLADAGIYTPAEHDSVNRALDSLAEEASSGSMDASGFEDVHSLVEHRLTELCGGAGAKIQTGRSRNEQTATAQRLYMKESASAAAGAIQSLMNAMIEKASENMDAIMPGYTHCRPAQPIRFSFYLAAHVAGLSRDMGRVQDALRRLDECPAGSGAVAGAPFGLDREKAARLLGFAMPSLNALDSVSDRDMQIEIVSCAALLMVRLSRIAEDLILWSSPAFGFVSLGDTYCTSSSLMPQKKNPDALELIRGKAARVAGDLTALLMLCKGLPTGYQKDLQEDKERLFDAVDTVLSCLAVFEGVVREMTVNAGAMKSAIGPECMATDEADMLVQKGMPFRQAYSQVASAIAAGEYGNGTAAVSPEDSVERRRSAGGTAKSRVAAMLEAARTSSPIM